MQYSVEFWSNGIFAIWFKVQEIKSVSPGGNIIYTTGFKDRQKCPPKSINQKQNEGSNSRCQRRLAASTARDVLALATGLSPRNSDATPRPVGASTGSTKNVDISSAAGDSSLDVAHGKTSDRDAVGGGAGRAAVLVVLLDDDAVLGDSGEGDVLVGDALDGAGGTVDSLDADTCKTLMLDTGMLWFW
jgi:hypothetical protein